MACQKVHKQGRIKVMVSIQSLIHPYIFTPYNFQYKTCLQLFFFSVAKQLLSPFLFSVSCWKEEGKAASNLTSFPDNVLISPGVPNIHNNRTQGEVRCSGNSGYNDKAQGEPQCNSVSGQNNRTQGEEHCQGKKLSEICV